MKKVFVIIVSLVLVSTANVKAQGKVQLQDFHMAPKPTTPTPLTIELENVMISSVKFNEGSNKIQVPGGRGTLGVTKRGSVFTVTFFTDAAGKIHRLQPSTPGATNGGQQPSCKCPMPDACFSTQDKNIGLCICKACDLSSGQPEVYSIGLLLPAVQKTRGTN